MSRAELAAALWPDSSEAQARGNLRNAMHRLRQALPALQDRVTWNGPDLVWRDCAQIDVDVWRFWESARGRSQRSLEAARAVYRGALLPGWHEEWALAAREGLQRDFVEVLERLADLAEDARALDEFVGHAEHLRQLDRLSEAHVRRLMRAYALRGDSAAVERVFQDARATLRAELDCEPSAVTVDLYRRLRAVPGESAPSRSKSEDDPRSPAGEGSLRERLAQVQAEGDVRVAFSRLGHLSVVRPAEHRLALHDDVRSILAKDLEWREPDRWAAMRQRALHQYRERAAWAETDEERQWLFNERLFLWSHALVRRLMFREAEAGLMWLEPGRPDDRPAIMRAWREWMSRFLQADATQGLSQALERSLQSRCLRLRVVRHRDGTVLGFSGAIAICRESLPILLTSPNTAALVRARWSEAELAALPAGPEKARLFHLRYAAHGTHRAEAVRALLLRDVMAMLAPGGTYYVTTGLTEHKALVETLRFRRLPEARCWNQGARVPDDSYELDLTGIGFEAWIAELMCSTASATEPGATASTPPSSAASGPAPWPPARGWRRAWIGRGPFTPRNGPSRR